MNTINSMMIHSDGPINPTNIRASRFMGFLAAAVQTKSDITLSEELKKLFSTSGTGYLFEAMGHNRLLNSDESYVLKPLLIKPWPKLKPGYPTFFFKCPVSLIRTIEDIGILSEKHYGLPVTRNFPFVDAIIQPNTLIQFTISPKYHSGAKERIESIRSKLTGDRSSNQMIFAIPQSSEEIFHYQEGLGNILQFLCFDDVTTSPSVLMNSNEKIFGIPL